MYDKRPKIMQNVQLVRGQNLRSINHRKTSNGQIPLHHNCQSFYSWPVQADCLPGRGDLVTSYGSDDDNTEIMEQTKTTLVLNKCHTTLNIGYT